MYFLNPLACLLVAVLPLLVLFYLRRPVRRRRMVSNLYLWPRHAVPRQARLGLQWRQDRWRLLWQLLFLLLLILALARPAVVRGGAPGRRVAFIFDASASMNVQEDTRTRFELAREKALAWLQRLEKHDRVMVILAATHPVLVSDFQSDRQALRHSISTLVPTHAPADLTAAVLMARLAAQDAEVLLFTDGTAAAQLPAAVQEQRLHYIRVGQREDNVAISRLEVRRHLYSPYDQELFAEVINFSASRSAPVRFSLSIGDTQIKEAVFTLEPGERRAMVAESLRSKQGVVTAHIAVQDGLDIDNHAYAVMPQPQPISVLLVSAGHFFIEKALEVHPQVTMRTMPPETFRRVGLQEAFDVIICDGFQPQHLGPGAYLILNPQPGNRQAANRARLPMPALSVVRPQHPLLAFVNIDGLVLSEVWPLKAPPGSIVLVEADRQPVLVAEEHAGRRIVTVGFDLRAPQFALSVSLPILLSNVIDWLAAPQEPEMTSLNAGEPLRWQLPASLETSSMTITEPSGMTVRRRIVNRVLTFDGTMQTGVYTLQGHGYRRRFSVNLFAPEESNIQPILSTGNETPALQRQDTRSRASMELWPYALIVALLVLMLEWASRCLQVVRAPAAP